MSPAFSQKNTPARSEPVGAESLEQRFAQRLESLRAALAGAEPARVALASRARLKPEGQLSFGFWGRPVRIAYPEWIAYPEGSEQPLSAFDQALLLYYLSMADGEPLSQQWIAFSDLPDGRFYNQAFQSYTGQELGRAFRDDRAAFEAAAQALGGQPIALGDAAYAFQALPCVPLLVVYWQGDEDFPSTCQVLFDAAASHYLPTDGYAILGSMLTRRLMKQRA